MKRYKAQEMAELYAKWQQSGKTKKAFCKEEGIMSTTFHYWVKKLQAPGPMAKKKKAAFTPLVFPQNTLPNGKQPVMRINFNAAVSIDFYDMVDAGYIKSLCQ